MKYVGYVKLSRDMIISFNVMNGLETCPSCLKAYHPRVSPRRCRWCGEVFEISIFKSFVVPLFLMFFITFVSCCIMIKVSYGDMYINQRTQNQILLDKDAGDLYMKTMITYCNAKVNAYKEKISPEIGAYRDEQVNFLKALNERYGSGRYKDTSLPKKILEHLKYVYLKNKK